MADTTRRDQAALTARWLDTAARPDLYPPPGETGMLEPPGASRNERGASSTARTFAADLSSVRIHEGDGVAEQAGALALTQGRDIHFARGAFDPASERGRFLIGHELAHVVQQRDHTGAARAKAAGPAASALHDTALEAEADRVGRRVAQGQRAGTIMGQVTSSVPVAQHFGSGEHMRIGDSATADEAGDPCRVQLADDYSVIYGEMVAWPATTSPP